MAPTPAVQRTVTERPPIGGTCAPGWDGVRDGFVENFAHGEVGASAAVSVDGEIVVDLWGGHADLARTRPWGPDTLVNVWSTTKMMAALCVLTLHDRGALSLDDPVAAHWPEFGARGKGGVLIRHVMSHTAGLPVFDEYVDDRDVFDWEACCARLAAQPARWPPGEVHAYHSETQGWLLGEVVRRVDGRTLGAFFRDEVAGPVGADFHIGLADEHHGRVADMATLDAVRETPTDADLVDLDSATSRRSLTLVNTAAWRRAELPASNGHGNARAVVRALAPLVGSGPAPLSDATVDRTFEVQSDGIDRMTGRHFRFGVGYALHCDTTPLGVNDRTLWWAGWGGSMAVVDVENRMIVAYAMNRMLGEDLRAARVVFAAHAAHTRSCA